MPLLGWDHVELWVGNAKQAAYFYENAFGFTRTAYAGPETGVRDLTKKDNFHLTGPGVNKKTGVAFMGTVTWTLTLKDGTYSYRSDAHPALRGSLRVS